MDPNATVNGGLTGVPAEDLADAQRHDNAPPQHSSNGAGYSQQPLFYEEDTRPLDGDSGGQALQTEQQVVPAEHQNHQDEPQTHQAQHGHELHEERRLTYQAGHSMSHEDGQVKPDKPLLQQAERGLVQEELQLEGDLEVALPDAAQQIAPGGPNTDQDEYELQQMQYQQLVRDGRPLAELELQPGPGIVQEDEQEKLGSPKVQLVELQEEQQFASKEDGKLQQEGQRLQQNQREAGQQMLLRQAYELEVQAPNHKDETQPLELAAPQGMQLVNQQPEGQQELQEQAAQRSRQPEQQAETPHGQEPSEGDSAAPPPSPTPVGGIGCQPHSRRRKSQKHAKKHAAWEPRDVSAPKDEDTAVVGAPSTIPRRATEFLFDSKTAAALQSLCALQHQGRAASFSAAATDYREIDELEQCFIVEDDISQAQVLEQERAERLQRVESLRMVAIIRQSLTTEKALQGLHEALASEEVIVGVAKDMPETRKCLAAEAGGTHDQQKERLQSQADRLRKQAQSIHDRIMRQAKAKQAQFKATRKEAARSYAERKAEMLQALQYLQLRLEAVLQHRRLELLGAYGFLRRDVHTTDFSLRAKIPSAAGKAIGLQRGLENPNWTLLPQTLRLRLDLCRAVRDGVPRGQYVMMVSVWNRLGGHRLVWTYLNQDTSSSDETKQNGGAEQDMRGDSAGGLATGSCAVSAPVAFAAMYFSECLRFDETLYLNCPSEADLKPSMCLVFQLYLLRGAVSPVDKVVAWGAFPLVGPEGCVVEGRFKVPLFLGEVDTSIQRYIDMEEMLRTRLDSWLCNLYFRVIRLPKELDGLQEFEVPLHYTGRMLNIPNELPLPKESRRASSIRSIRSSRSSHSSRTSSLANSSIQHIVRNMQPHRDTIDGSEPFEDDRQARHRSLSYGKQPFCKVTENELATYQYSVISEQTLLHRRVTGRKLRHICNELFDEFSISSDIKELSLAGAALLFALGALWFAVFVALFGSWVCFKACNIPVYSAEISGLYIRFGYVQELLSLGSAALYAGSGFLTALLVFAVLCAVAHSAHCFIGRLPSAAYRFLAPLGFWVVLLPVVLAAIEGIGGEYAGVTFALYSYLKRENDSGAIGAGLTVLMDIAYMAISFILFYYYAVAIHHNGRVLDCHRRVTADHSAFRLPSDTQVSDRYMKGCCYKAKQFLGLEGETRRVQVTELRVLSGDAAAPEGRLEKKSRCLVTTYVAIFTVHPTTKQQTLYRHFLRYPDGTVVEQLYSVPLSLELSASSYPVEVRQYSFEETGFLQNQPAESVLPFDEWRSCRFGNMPPAIILDSTETAAKHQPSETLALRAGEVPGLTDCLKSLEKGQQLSLPKAEGYHDLSLHGSGGL